MLHISFDTETYGLCYGYDVRSIGAVVFDPKEGTIDASRQFYQALDNPSTELMSEASCEGWTFYDEVDGAWRKYPLKRDPQTKAWWQEQDAKASETAFVDRIDMAEGWLLWEFWMQERVEEAGGEKNICLWSNGAAFDPGILQGVAHALGRKENWFYRAPRDTRTAFDLAGIDDHPAWVKKHPGPLNLPHHALDDAWSQGLAVGMAVQRIHHAMHTLNMEHGVNYLGSIYA